MTSDRADVVHGDGHRFDERRVIEGERRSAGARASRAGTFQRSCSAPGESIPMKSRFWQMCWLPARQAGQVPSQESGMTVTRSPTVHSSTPSPTAAIMPLISWPNTRGCCHARVHVAVEDVQIGTAETGEGDRICTSPRPGGVFGYVRNSRPAVRTGTAERA